MKKELISTFFACAVAHAAAASALNEDLTVLREERMARGPTLIVYSLKFADYIRKYPLVAQTHEVSDNIAALCGEDMERLSRGDSSDAVIDAAQKRFARAHGVPLCLGSLFSSEMTKSHLHESLVSLATRYSAWTLESQLPAVHAASMSYIRAASDDALKDLLRHFSCVWDQFGDAPAGLWRHYAKERSFRDLTAHSFERTARGLLKDHMSEDFLMSISLPLKLRGTSLIGRPIDLEKTLMRVKDMDEERALAILSFLRERTMWQDAFWNVENTLSTPYLLLLVQDCTLAFPTVTNPKALTLLMRCGELEESVFWKLHNDLNPFSPKKHGRALDALTKLAAAHKAMGQSFEK